MSSPSLVLPWHLPSNGSWKHICRRSPTRARTSRHPRSLTGTELVLVVLSFILITYWIWCLWYIQSHLREFSHGLSKDQPHGNKYHSNSKQRLFPPSSASLLVFPISVNATSFMQKTRKSSWASSSNYLPPRLLNHQVLCFYLQWPPRVFYFFLHPQAPPLLQPPSSCVLSPSWTSGINCFVRHLPSIYYLHRSSSDIL